MMSYFAMAFLSPEVESLLVPALALAGIALLLELYWLGKQQDQALIFETEHPSMVNVIFSDLSGRSGGAQSKAVFQALEVEIGSDAERLPIHLMRSSVALSLDEGGYAKLRQQAQEILQDEGADVLIWGQIFSADGSYALSFLKNNKKGNGQFARLLCGVEKIHFSGGDLSKDDALAVAALSMAHAFEVCDDEEKRQILGLTQLHDRLTQGVQSSESQDVRLSVNRKRLWAHAWWSSVIALQKGEEALLIEASLLWDELLKTWPKENSSYDIASVRNNQAVVCFFLAQITQELKWFRRTYDIGRKAQSYFRKTGYPRRWSELEYLILSVTNAVAIKEEDEALMQENLEALQMLQKIWTYAKHPDFWVRLDVEADHLRKGLQQQQKDMRIMLPSEVEDLPPLR